MPIDRAVLFRLATSTRLERAVRGVARGEDAAWRAASRYVAGRTPEDARRVTGEQHARGVTSSVDQFGELVEDTGVAAKVGEDYLRLATSLAGFPDDTWLSIDLSHLGLDIEPAGCANRLAAIAQALPAGRRIQVGAEDHARTDAVLTCVLDVSSRGLANRLGATAQANLHRAPEDLEHLITAGVHVRTWSLTSPPVVCQSVSTCPSATTGSGTGCDASPSPAAPEDGMSGAGSGLLPKGDPPPAQALGRPSCWSLRPRGARGRSGSGSNPRPDH